MPGLIHANHVSLPPIKPKGQALRPKRTDLLFAVLLTILGAAVLAIAVLAAMVEKRNATIRGLQEKISSSSASHPLSYYSTHGGNLPVVATSRKSLGSGYILSLRNESTDNLHLVLTLDNPESSRHRTVNVVLDSQQTAEFGHFEDWKLSAGDTVEISNQGFNPVTMRL